ncbi:MAG: preprotein translocase subunit SecG [Gammaproteobacteria bacterium]
MKIFLIAITVISALLMVGAILLQQGKGASLGAAFGSGAQGGLAGETGRANFLTRTTAVLVTIFFLACLTLSLFLGGSREDRVRELLEDGQAPVPIESRAGEDAPKDAANDAANDDTQSESDDNAAEDDRPIARE